MGGGRGEVGRRTHRLTGGVLRVAIGHPFVVVD